jgi:hypothetical protein
MTEGQPRRCGSPSEALSQTDESLFDGSNNREGVAGAESSTPRRRRPTAGAAHRVV